MSNNYLILKITISTNRTFLEESMLLNFFLKINYIYIYIIYLFKFLKKALILQEMSYIYMRRIILKYFNIFENDIIGVKASSTLIFIHLTRYLFSLFSPLKKTKS